MKKVYGNLHQFKVTYCSVLGDHILATPEPTHTEIIETDWWPKLVAHIEAQNDMYGHKFKYAPDHKWGYWFISGQGGVRITPYRRPKVTRL